MEELDQVMRRYSRLVMLRTLKFPKAEDGAVMVEFVIVAPLFLFLVMAIMQWTGIAHADALLQYGNFMSARAGAVHYEAMSKNWDGGGTNFKTRLQDKMEDAAGHAMGPIYRQIHGFRSATAIASSTIDLWPLRKVVGSAPVAVLDLNVKAGTVESGLEYMPTWIVSQTEIDLGLPFPWVGSIIELMFRNAAGPATAQQAAQMGMDPFATPNPPFFVRPPNYSDFPFIKMRSDSFLDTRNPAFTGRWIAFPFSAAGNAYRDLDGNTVNVGNNPIAQPIAYPAQIRFRP